jgi:hypothetical protein
MKLAEHVVRMGEMRILVKIFVEELKRRDNLCYRMENNMSIRLAEIGCEGWTAFNLLGRGMSDWLL